MQTFMFITLTDWRDGSERIVSVRTGTHKPEGETHWQMPRCLRHLERFLSRLLHPVEITCVYEVPAESLKKAAEYWGLEI